VIFLCFPVWMALVASTHPARRCRAARSRCGSAIRGGRTTHADDGRRAEAGGVPVATMMQNSLIMALGITFGKIAISLLSAFAIVYFRFPFRMLFFWLIFITLMLPVEVRILPTYDVVARLGMLNSYSGLIIPLIASATATFLFRQFFLTIPDELVEAARIDRAGPIRFFFDILLPLSRTNIAALFIILFIYGWNQYLWPFLITTDTDLYTIVMGIQRMVNVGEGLPIWHLIDGHRDPGHDPAGGGRAVMQRLFVKGLWKARNNPWPTDADNVGKTYPGGVRPSPAPISPSRTASSSCSSAPRAAASPRSCA
jgi:sn-glycerol 3-phosphate transport system permease protein